MVKEAVHVQVDTHRTHFAVIIGVKNVFPETVTLLDIALGVFSEFTVLIAIGDEPVTKVGTGVAVILVKSAHTVVVVEHIIYLQLGRQALPDVPTLLLENTLHVVRTHIVEHVVFLQHFGMAVAACPERGGDIQTACAVVHIQVVGNRVAILVHARQVVLETEAVALRLLERDAHHSLGRGGITGSRVLDDVHMLDLVTAQSGQFTHVLHLAAVDIDLGITTSQHLDATIALGLERRHPR